MKKNVLEGGTISWLCIAALLYQQFKTLVGKESKFYCQKYPQTGHNSDGMASPLCFS